MGDISLSTDIFRCHYVENHVGIGKEKATQVCGISYSFGLFAASHFFYDKKICQTQWTRPVRSVPLTGPGRRSTDTGWGQGEGMGVAAGGRRFQTG